MKHKLLTGILYCFFASYSFCQSPDVLNYKTLSLNGLNWNSNEQEVIQIFGKPDSIYNPNFECGPYSNDQLSNKIVKLIKYKSLDFITVNGKVRFYNIYLNPTINLSLNTGKLTLSYNTTIEELKEHFPNSYNNWKKNGDGILRLWPCDNCDSEIMIYIKNGHIQRIRFFDPC